MSNSEQGAEELQSGESPVRDRRVEAAVSAEGVSPRASTELDALAELLWAAIQQKDLKAVATFTKFINGMSDGTRE